MPFEVGTDACGAGGATNFIIRHMAVWALGINHTTAPLDLRGRFAFALDQIAPTLQGLRQALNQSGSPRGVESAIISTCNRTEI